MNSDDYHRFLGMARRHSRRANEAEDLLHDSLLVAAREGRLDPSRGADLRWLGGVMRKLAAMKARGAIRRRRLEHRPPPREVEPPAPISDARRAFPNRMSKSARAVAALVLHGLNRQEIAQALRVTPAALRQRMCEVRRCLALESPEQRQEVLALSYLRQKESSDLEFGLIRRSLLTCLRRRGGLGTHDPDGHLLVIGANLLTKRGPAAT